LELPLFFVMTPWLRKYPNCRMVNRPDLICRGVSQTQSVYVREKRAGCDGDL
jgi:hypothetical protein